MFKSTFRTPKQHMKIKLEQIKRKIGEQQINAIAKSSGFQKREPRKVTGYSFFLGFCMMVQLGQTGLRDWAKSIGRLTQKLVSKQGLQKKLQFRHEAFARQLLGFVLKQCTASNGHQGVALFAPFKEVYVEDSTCVGLPRNLSSFCPGPHSKTHGECATARIQLRMELVSESYEGVFVGSYRENDQGFAHRIVEILTAGCLVIRDKGYFVLAAFRAIMEKKAFFLSRLRFGTTVFDAQTGEKMDLLKELKALKKAGRQVLDKEILLGGKEKLPVRLVAIEAPEEAKRMRQHKARTDRSAKAAHSREYIQLLGWTIFITNVNKETWGGRDIIRAYRYRWRIEIVFKCWKSKFNLDKFFEGRETISPPRAAMTIYLMLAWLTLTMGAWYGYFVHRVYEEKKKFISMLLFADFVKERFWEILLTSDLDVFIGELARYYSHDKRKSRKCYLEFLYEINLS